MQAAGHRPDQLRGFLGASLQPKQEGERAHRGQERIFSETHGRILFNGAPWFNPPDIGLSQPKRNLLLDEISTSELF
jgi:hypothetical protein